jgi:hypothetical protein
MYVAVKLSVIDRTTEAGDITFKERVLRKIFGPKWEEVTGNRRKLHK